MKSIFEKSTEAELRGRLEALGPAAARQWGKMDVAQMLAHCTASLQVPVGDLTVKKTFVSLIGWMFKGMVRSEKPFSKNSPTAAEFLISDARNFDKEKQRCLEAFNKVAQGPATITCLDHPFFGKMAAEDWGLLIYKHMDHHLRQFSS